MCLIIPCPDQENTDREQEMMDILVGFGTLGTANTPEPSGKAAEIHLEKDGIVEWAGRDF